MSRSKAKNLWIREIFEEVEKDFPNKSEEFLYAMTIDRYRERRGKDIDHGDVAYALAPD